MIAVALLAIARAEEPPVELPDYRVHTRHPPPTRLDTTGFRATLPGDGFDVATRIAFVADPDGLLIGEATVRGHAGWRWVSLATEVAATAATSPRWSGAGLGNTVIDARFLFGGKVTCALGLRVTLPSGERHGAHGAVGWWGTVPAATTPTTGVALAWEGATERWAWHVHVGQHADAWWAFAYVPETWDLDAIVATIQPLGGRWSVVAEGEVLYAQSPVHLRALARRDLGRGWTVDAGLAVPIVALLHDPTLQVLAAARHRW